MATTAFGAIANRAGYTTVYQWETRGSAMTLSDKTSVEVQNPPEELNREILDFILFVEQRYATPARPARRNKPEWGNLRIDTRGWRLDRDEANAR